MRTELSFEITDYSKGARTIKLVMYADDVDQVDSYFVCDGLGASKTMPMRAVATPYGIERNLGWWLKQHGIKEWDFATDGIDNMLTLACSHANKYQATLSE